MRTNIDIDERLMAEAQAASGLSTKKATVEAALRLLVSRERRRQAIARLAGIGWEGDLDAFREGRPALIVVDRFVPRIKSGVLAMTTNR